jgi:hypothetical protein
MASTTTFDRRPRRQLLQARLPANIPESQLRAAEEFGSIIRILWIFEGNGILGTKVFAGIPSFMEA